jgi:aspartyl-tRNA(Asn)/glutamyl-tRNA(Gln) amidotransferase subunit C
MSLSADHVRKIARLSRLALSEPEVEAYRARLSAVVAYIDRLRSVDLTGVEPMTAVGDTVNRLSPDDPGPTLPTATLLAMAPEHFESFVRVPRVLDEGGGGA